MRRPIFSETLLVTVIVAPDTNGFGEIVMEEMLDDASATEAADALPDRATVIVCCSPFLPEYVIVAVPVRGPAVPTGANVTGIETDCPGVIVPGTVLFVNSVEPVIAIAT